MGEKKRSGSRRICPFLKLACSSAPALLPIDSLVFVLIYYPKLSSASPASATLLGLNVPP